MGVKCVTVVVFGSSGYETFSDVLEESLCLTSRMLLSFPRTQRRRDQRRGAGGGELAAAGSRAGPEAGGPDRVLPVR